MISAFLNTVKIPELRRRILFTLAVIVIVRLGAAITTPGVNQGVLQEWFRTSLTQRTGGGLAALFNLFSDRVEAFRPAARSPQTYRLIFKDSVRGLVPGAPVEFRGIPIGEVADIRAQIDLKTFEFSVPVTIRLDPQRLGTSGQSAPSKRGNRRIKPLRSNVPAIGESPSRLS